MFQSLVRVSMILIGWLFRRVTAKPYLAESSDLHVEEGYRRMVESPRTKSAKRLNNPRVFGRF